MTSLFDFFNYEQFMKDVAVITDTARGKKLTMAQLGMAIMRNYDAVKSARRLSDLADPQSVQAVVGEFEFRPQRPHADPARGRR